MSLNKWILPKLSRGLVKINLHKFYPVKKNNSEPAQLKVVFFCGSSGLSYLNASLISLFKTWGKTPEIYIISDGSSMAEMQDRLITWPSKVEIQSWQFFANYFKENGNEHLYNYANNSVFGKKLVGILYYAKKFPILYSDTDVLWFNSPLEKNFKLGGVKPKIIMGQDVGYFYHMPLLEAVSEQKCLTTTALNSGLMYLDGDFSGYPNWDLLCETLGTYGKENSSIMFPEQTTFAILNNHFNPNNSFTKGEILIKIDDEFSFKHTRNLFPKILARHYVNVKGTAFWRDFLYIAFQRKIKK